MTPFLAVLALLSSIIGQVLNVLIGKYTSLYTHLHSLAASSRYVNRDIQLSARAQSPSAGIGTGTANGDDKSYVASWRNADLTLMIVSSIYYTLRQKCRDVLYLTETMNERETAVAPPSRYWTMEAYLDLLIHTVSRRTYHRWAILSRAHIWPTQSLRRRTCRDWAGKVAKAFRYL